MNKSRLTHVAARQLCAVLLAALFCVPAVASVQPHPIRTESGLVSGVALSNGLEVFKGIPFAAPPVGKLRWQPPQPPATWQGVPRGGPFWRTLHAKRVAGTTGSVDSRVSLQNAAQ